jgi:hypothetical protein
MNTYRISTHDPGDEFPDGWGWTVRMAGLPLWALRGAIREMRGRGYDDDVSILVEREDDRG